MTVPALNNALKSLLTRAGAENPDGDTREILCAVLNCSHHQLILRDDEVPPEVADRAMELGRRRASGEPLQYVLGSWSFMGREYLVGEGVLIPRDDTEVVVTEALCAARRFCEPVIADLCSGTGIIAITLAKELDATVYAVEKSARAFRYLEENLSRHQAKVKAIRADLADCVRDFDDGSLDMIVSNPPYICSEELPTLQSEVQYEPRLALDGGRDGCDFYRTIVRLWTPKLKDGGVIAFELGEGQFETISHLLSENGYTDVKGAPDLQGTLRAISAKRQNVANPSPGGNHK